MQERDQYKERHRQRRPAQRRHSYRIPCEVEARLEEILAAVHEQLDPGYRNHALVVALLDQVSEDVLAGRYTLRLSVRQVKETKPELRTGE